jgi:hypothetical protein
MLNKFDSAFGEGTYRAFLNAIGNFLFVGFAFYQVSEKLMRTDRIEDAVVAGALAALGSLGFGAVIAKSDQARFEKGLVKPADVTEVAKGPIAI